MKRTEEEFQRVAAFGRKSAMRRTRVERHLSGLNMAAAYYRRGLKDIIEDCSHDKPDIAKLKEHAQAAIRAADYELKQVGLG